MRLLPLLIPTLALVFAVPSAFGQAFARDLNGFRLGQTRDTTHQALGKPDKAGTNEEGIYYEAFLISEEPLLYMVFSVSRARPGKHLVDPDNRRE